MSFARTRCRIHVSQHDCAIKHIDKERSNSCAPREFENIDSPVWAVSKRVSAHRLLPNTQCFGANDTCEEGHIMSVIDKGVSSSKSPFLALPSHEPVSSVRMKQPTLNATARLQARRPLLRTCTTDALSRSPYRARIILFTQKHIQRPPKIASRSPWDICLEINAVWEGA